MVERVIGAFEARRTFGKLLRDVEAKRGPVVVERNGEPVAAVVPMDLYNRWKEDREALFGSIRTAAERANLTDQEAMTLALEGQRWARGQP